MIQTTAAALALTVASLSPIGAGRLAAQSYYDIPGVGDLSRVGDCIQICREYKWCDHIGDDAMATRLFVEFWRTCRAHDGLPDLIYIGGSVACPDPAVAPWIYTRVDCP